MDRTEMEQDRNTRKPLINADEHPLRVGERDGQRLPEHL
jgi:hypothetical protein